MKPRVLAVVPARAQSKRIPGKNKKFFLGKPLIDWSIEAALSSDCVTDVYVTTDDAEIISFQTRFPTVRFVKRPEFLALDETPGIDPIIHLMNSFEKKYDYVLLLQPTSPLRTNFHIDAAFAELKMKSKKQIVSVKKTTDTLNHIVYIDQDGVRFFKENVNKLDDLNSLRVLNGAIYISEWEELLFEKSFLGKNTSFFEMEEMESVDIDYPSDWERAECFGKGKMN